MTETEETKPPEAKPKPNPKPARRKKRRRIFVLMQWIGIPLLCLAALAAGLVIGYVYIGKRPMDDVYEINTWRHLYDLVFSET
jgi:hypothetical protein